MANAVIGDYKVYGIKIIPEAKTGNVIREYTYDKKSLSKHAGKDMRYVVIELTNGTHTVGGVRRGGQKAAGRKIHTLSDLHDADDFQWLIDECIEPEWATENNKGILVAEKTDNNGDYIPIPVTKMEMEGKFIVMPTPVSYADKDGVERNEVSFFINRGTLEERPEAVAQQYAFALERLGIKPESTSADIED